MIATDPLSLVFIFCFLLGFGFFLVMNLLGSHGHHAHVGGHAHASVAHHAPVHTAGHVSTAGHTHAAGQASAAHTPGQQSAGSQRTQAHSENFLLSYINPTSIAIFLLGFGFLGYLFHNNTNLVAPLALLLAVIGGLVISVCLLLLLNRLFVNSEGSTEQDVVDRTGMIGRVSITIPEKGIGEIIYTSPGGMRKSVPARGLEAQRLERDQEVVVVNYQNGVAEVDTWEHFMNEPGRSADSPSPADMDRLSMLLNHIDSTEMEMVMRQEQQKE